jgi:hypothetical protein
MSGEDILQVASKYIFEKRPLRLFVLSLSPTNNTQMKKNIVFLLILIPIIWISCDGMGHPTIDFRKVENLMPQHPDSALMLLEQIENKENLPRKDKAHYYLLLTEAKDKNYIPHTSDSLIAIATDYYEKTEYVNRKAKAWYYKGRINQDLGHPLKAQEYYLKALRDEEQVTDYALLGRINNSIGMLYTYQTVYEKALPFQKRAVENFRMLKDSMGQIFALRDLGRTFSMLGYKDSAIMSNQVAISLMGKEILPSVYTELADLYVSRQQIGEAYELLHIALRNMAKPQAKYPTYLVLGELFQQCGQIDSARVYLQACADSAPLPKTRAGGLFQLKEIAFTQKQWELAASLSHRYESLRDSIEKEMQAESIRNVQAFYSYNDIERDLWEARLYASQQKFFYTLSIIGCLVLLVGSIFTFIRYRQERKKALRRLKDNEKQILKKEREIKDLSYVRDSLAHDIQEYKIKEQQLAQENEKQLKETSEQLELKRKQLEKLSRIKESRERDISILKTENSNLRNQEETRKEKLAQLQVGRLYDKFRSPISWTPTNDDWNKLFVTVEACFPNFAIDLQKSVPLNESEKKICYLIKIGVKPGAIAILLNLGNASIYRKRLYEKLTGKKGNAKDLDRYISNL